MESLHIPVENLVRSCWILQAPSFLIKWDFQELTCTKVLLPSPIPRYVKKFSTFFILLITCTVGIGLFFLQEKMNWNYLKFMFVDFCRSSTSFS